MHGTHLVEVVALVGAASGVHELRERADEERGFVHGGGVWPGEEGASFAVLAVGIGKEKRVVCSEPLAYACALADICVFHYRSVVGASVFDYEMVAFHV